MKKAFANGFRLWYQNPGECIDYALIVTCIMLMPVAPLMFLSAGSLAGLAWLAPVLFVLIVLPVRSNAACVLRNVVGGTDSMNSVELVCGGQYSKGLLRGLRVMLCMILWTLPGIYVTKYAIDVYKGAGGNDGLTVIREACKTFAGGQMTTDGIMKTIKMLVLIYAAAWLPVLIGLMLHSSSRHVYAAGKNALKGRHGKYLLCWLCSLVVFVPFLLALLLCAKSDLLPTLRVLKSDMMQLMNLVSHPLEGIVSLFKPGFWKVIIVFVVLFLPAVPLRHLILASFVHGDASAEKN